MIWRKRSKALETIGWGGRIRTSAWRNQNPLPYRLATPQSALPSALELHGAFIGHKWAFVGNDARTSPVCTQTAPKLSRERRGGAWVQLHPNTSCFVRRSPSRVPYGRAGYPRASHRSPETQTRPSWGLTGEARSQTIASWVHRDERDLVMRTNARNIAPPPQPKAAWVRRPNEVARNKRLDAQALVLLAYRATHAGDYALNERALAAAGSSGAGALASTASAGASPISPGPATASAGSRQGLSPASSAAVLRGSRSRRVGASGKAGRIVRREWFDGRFTLNGLAALLYLRAGTGGPAAFLRELQERFGWSRQTASNAVAELRSAGVLERVRMRAADETEPAEALGAVLNAMRVRVGNRPGQWLNSLALIGRRMAAEADGGGLHFYAVARAPKRGQVTKRPAPLNANLKALIDADGAKTLAPKLRRDATGLRDFLQKHGPEALAMMASVLRRHMITGKPIGSVKSWRFFEAAIAEERHLRSLAVEGVRPGDVMGAHKWRPPQSLRAGGGSAMTTDLATPASTRMQASLTLCQRAKRANKASEKGTSH
jgi:hypothetical protein